MIKKIMLVFSALVIICAIISVSIFGPFIKNLEHFEADPANGFFADFYVYIPSSVRESVAVGEYATFLIQPNNSGINSDDPQVHIDDAWWMTFGRHWLANDLQVVLLVPAFVRPSQEWWIYTHALDRDTFETQREDLGRLDLQLLKMIDLTRKNLAERNIQTEEKVLVQGYSASGMFANRFAMIHPTRVKAVAAGSPGGMPILPIDSYRDISLNYPIGIADLEILTGAQFNLQAYQEIPQLIYMGSLDDNDSVDFIDGWDADMAKIVDAEFGTTPISRWQRLETIYQEVAPRVKFKLVDGVGHDRRALQIYATQFFKEILER